MLPKICSLQTQKQVNKYQCSHQVEVEKPINRVPLPPEEIRAAITLSVIQRSRDIEIAERFTAYKTNHSPSQSLGQEVESGPGWHSPNYGPNVQYEIRFEKQDQLVRGCIEL